MKPLWQSSSVSKGQRHNSELANTASKKSEMAKPREKFSSLSFGGYQKVYSHVSETQKCEMQFAIYLPPQCRIKKLPVIYFLSGLTMDHIEFIEKSGIQRIASNYGVIVVAPDSSPRKTNTPGENEKWNIGVKASYYIDSTAEPWCKHYKMYSYLTKELPCLINKHFPVLPDKQSIMGHSIGGHGAFVIKMLNPSSFKSVSALSPVCDITKAPHSIEGLKLYLGSDKEYDWNKWNATLLARNYGGPPFCILIDQGSEDEYLKEHLFPEDFLKACQFSNIPVTYNLRDGYTHNYYFVATFIEEHIKYHLQYLK